jgi:hypothetical protein
MPTLDLGYKVSNLVERNILHVVTYIQSNFPKITNNWYKNAKRANLKYEVSNLVEKSIVHVVTYIEIKKI